MNKDLERIWEQAADTGEPVPVGDIVVCDSCSGDFTSSDESGGIIFTSNAYCPACTVKVMPDIKRYGEQSYIRATCPPRVSFADFVRGYRGPDSRITVTGFSKGSK